VVHAVPSLRRNAAPALLAAEAQRSIEQAIDEPLEAHGTKRSSSLSVIIWLLTTVFPMLASSRQRKDTQNR
jgi:hypothetical protein